MRFLVQLKEWISFKAASFQVLYFDANFRSPGFCFKLKHFEYVSKFENIPSWMHGLKEWRVHISTFIPTNENVPRFVFKIRRAIQLKFHVTTYEEVHMFKDTVRTTLFHWGVGNIIGLDIDQKISSCGKLLLNSAKIVWLVDHYSLPSPPKYLVITSSCSSSNIGSNWLHQVMIKLCSWKNLSFHQWRIFALVKRRQSYK